jgi:AcrR family transcriptional regulator
VGARKPEDVERFMELLWRAPTSRTRGPRPALSSQELVAAATAIADRDGIHRLSIRSVAQRLKVAPMSVYTYVPGKAELLLLMLDAAFSDMPRAQPADSSWRARVRAIADDNRRLYSAHPWIAELPPNRPPLGPGTLGKYEYELSAFEGVGLSDIEIDASLQLVLGFVGSCAIATARARAEISDSEQTDSEWWSDQEPALLRVAPGLDHKYPLGSRIGAASAAAQGGTYDPEHHYQFGLARVLDGLAVLIEALPVGGER